MRVDYATIGALHLANPAWDIPVVSLSANNNPYFYSDAALDEMEMLGAATARAIERTGRRAVLLASNSLSHLHWDREPDLPEDMGVERPFDHHQYAGDMELLQVVREGPTERLRDGRPEAHRGDPGRDQGGLPDLAAGRDGLARRRGRRPRLRHRDRDRATRWSNGCRGSRGAALVPGMPHLLAADPAPCWRGAGRGHPRRWATGCANAASRPCSCSPPSGSRCSATRCSATRT